MTASINQRLPGENVLPDFPEVKSHLRARLLSWTQTQMPHFSPLLGEVGRFRQHEGRTAQLARADSSSETLTYPKHGVSISLTREEMRTFDFAALSAKLLDMAQQMAELESRMMFTKIREAAESVGNSVAADGNFRPEHFFEMLNNIEMDFDPETGEPRGHQIVMHPETAAKIIPLMQSWEADPAFVAEHEAILARKREEWRAREDRRKLVD